MATIREELRRIHDMHNGSLEPETVVAQAKKIRSPLHNCFEWDDTIAGHKYRLVQARELIRSMRKVYAHDSRGPKTIREYTATYEVALARPGTYRATEEVMANEFSAAIVLRNFERALADLKRQYGHLKEYGQMLRNAAGDEDSG
jgi:hypothetical protein